MEEMVKAFQQVTKYKIFIIIDDASNSKNCQLGANLIIFRVIVL